ncbi:type IV secretion system protein VirB4 [Cytophagaceae bacterium YF14B1]|uniref:Type IV secretion system protein VirB4 n=1 Tax=Xanthocytophaga flava TaxID=3048013 RepID=A0AAE3QYS2_9BACT|nr:type IV secretion system protein VirB4 [Xanthocytophaga flavus]MDJ1485923.1 type IV secretion system protein VirB4 [Xanthocytophaga flavus]
MNLIKKKVHNLDSALPIFEIEDNLIVFKDGRVGAGFELDGLEMEKFPASRYSHLCDVFTGAIRILPPGSTVQKLDCYYYQPFTGQQPFTGYQPITTQTNGREMTGSEADPTEAGFFEKNLLNHFYNRQVLCHRSYLFVSLGIENQAPANPVNTLFAYGKAFLNDSPFKGIEERLSVLPRVASEFASSLSSEGIRIKRLDDSELREIYRMYFNLEFSPVPDSLQRPLSAHENCCILGEKKVNVISMLNQPGIIEPAVYNQTGVASPFVYPLTHYLQMPHILSVSISVTDTDKTLKSLDDEAKRNRFLDFLSTQDNVKKNEEITSFTHELRTHNKSTVQTSVTLIVWETDDSLRGEYCQSALKAFQLMGGANAMVETIDSANLYVSTAPGNSYNNYRKLLMSSDNASMYVNLITNYIQLAGSDELLCDRFRNPLRVKLFNTDLNNQNSITIGPSGSGKSYTIGNLIVQRFELDHTQIIIDVGGTYLSLMSALDGKYFEYDPESPLNLNPFIVDRIGSNDRIWTDHENESVPLYKLTGDKINYLTALLSVIWKGAKGDISQAERAVFTKLLPLYYNDYNARAEQDPTLSAPSIKGFYLWVEQFEKEGSTDYQRLTRTFDFNEFLVVLEPYAIGNYADVLNSDSHADVSDHRLICFDMAKIKKNPMLYHVIALLITELSLDVIRKYPEQRKYFYMDEAWSMLSDGMGEFVESMYRTVRKNNGSMCIITQGINEIVSSKMGPAILANAATCVVLNHTDQTEILKLASHLGLTTHETELIRSIRKNDQQGYRELFIKQGDYAKIYLMEVSTKIDAILTSKPEERDYLRKLQKQFSGNIHFAINEYVEWKQAGKPKRAQVASQYTESEHIESKQAAKKEDAVLAEQDLEEVVDQIGGSYSKKGERKGGSYE